jgi:hypothetical protein
MRVKREREREGYGANSLVMLSDARCVDLKVGGEVSVELERE